MPWLELLSIDSVATSDWEQLGLQPDIGWRDRYLAERGVSLEILEAEMPALADMFEVLITPFYLRYIVDLHEEGRLGGQRDVGDLLSSLIDSAIERERGAKAKQKKRFYEEHFGIEVNVDSYTQLAEAHARAGARPATLQAIVDASVALTRGEVPDAVIATSPY